MSKGGARPGAGRKVGQKAAHTLEAETYRRVLIEKIVANAAPLAEALLAKGLSGDVPALREINERALGKVKENIDVTSKGKQLTGINYIVPNGDNPQANTETARSEPRPEQAGS